MSTVDAMRQRMVELEATISDTGESESPAMRRARQGLSQMRDRVEDDIKIALRPALDVHLNGAPVSGHEIRIDALSKVLHSLQESVSAVAQALTGKATAFASLPTALRDDTALSLSAVWPGSFGATLRGPVDKASAEALRTGQEFIFPPEESRTALDAAVDTVLDIVELASRHDDASDDPVIEAVLPLGSRAYKHLLGLSGAIVDQQMSATIEWKHLGADTVTVVLDRATARRLNDVLTLNKMTEEVQSIRGRLGTVSDIRNRIELQTDAGDILNAKVTDDVVPELAGYFTHRVEADVIVTTVRSAATGLERRSYLVTGLATIGDDEDQFDSQDPGYPPDDHEDRFDASDPGHPHDT